MSESQEGCCTVQHAVGLIQDEEANRVQPVTNRCARGVGEGESGRGVGERESGGVLLEIGVQEG